MDWVFVYYRLDLPVLPLMTWQTGLLLLGIFSFVQDQAQSALFLAFWVDQMTDLNVKFKSP